MTVKELVTKLIDYKDDLEVYLLVDGNYESSGRIEILNEKKRIVVVGKMS